jgi:hypothetical protein
MTSIVVLHLSNKTSNRLSFAKKLFAFVGHVCAQNAVSWHPARIWLLLAERRGEGPTVHIRQLYVPRTGASTGSGHGQCHRGGGSHFG